MKIDTSLFKKLKMADINDSETNPLTTVLYQNSGCSGYGVSILQGERQLFLWVHIKRELQNSVFSHTGNYLGKCPLSRLLWLVN